MLEHLFIVGNNGVGKTTIAANLTAALADIGENVALVGYGSGHTTAAVRGAASCPQITKRRGKTTIRYSRGFRGAACIDICCGDDWSADFRCLLSSSILEKHLPQFVVHDIPWDMEELDIHEDGEEDKCVFVVTTPDISAIAAANSVLASIANGFPPGVRFGGVIANGITNSFSEALIQDFSTETGAEVIASITRSLMITACDYYNQTIIEAAPQSYHSFVFRRLARQVADNGKVRTGRHLTKQEMREWGRKWGEILAEYETGVVACGAGI